MEFGIQIAKNELLFLMNFNRKKLGLSRNEKTIFITKRNNITT